MPRFLRWLGRLALAFVALTVVAVGAVYALSERELGRASTVDIPPFTAPLPSESAELAEGERVARTIPPRSVGPLGRLGILLGEFRPSRYYLENETIPPAPADSALRAGHYIAWSSRTECHGGELAGDGRGAPPLAPMAHAYSPEEFAEFLTTGAAMGGRELEMMSEVARGRFRHLRTDEVASLHAYLKTLPAASTVDSR